MLCPNCSTTFSEATLNCPSCGALAGDPPRTASGVPVASNFNAMDDRCDWLTTLLLTIFLGKFGVHRFYTGHIAMGVLMFFTLGCCGVLWIYDIIMIVTDKYQDSEGRPLVRKI